MLPGNWLSRRSGLLSLPICLSSATLPMIGKGLIGKSFTMAESKSTGVVNI